MVISRLQSGHSTCGHSADVVLQQCTAIEQVGKALIPSFQLSYKYLFRLEIFVKFRCSDVKYFCYDPNNGKRYLQIFTKKEKRLFVKRK